MPEGTNYPGNSRNMKPEPVEQLPEKKIEQITTSPVIQRKKPLGKRIMETFTGEDMHSVGHYILFEVMLPAAKTMISDAASQGVERMLFGESVSRSRTTRSSGSYTSYNRYHSSAATRSEPRKLSQTARATHDFNDIVIPNRGEAEAVIDQLQEIINNYDVTSVNDLYGFVGITGSFTDNKWGWNDLRSARVVRVSDGYLLDLPKPMALD